MTINKRKAFIYIPFIILIVLLGYTWIKILTTSINAVLPHYFGIVAFTVLALFFVRDKTFKKPLIFTGIYLILCIVNLFSFLPSVLTHAFGITIGSVEIWTPGFNPFAFIIFIIYAILNFDALTDIYLDYKEAKGKL